MTDITVPLAEASIAQLRWFAEHALGLVPNPNPATRAETLRAQIARVHDRAEITVPAQLGADRAAVPAAPAAPAVRPPDALNQGSYQNGGYRRLRVIVERQDGPGGDRPVFLAVNGTSILVERGRESVLAEPYVEVLRNAVQTLYEMDLATGDMQGREVPQHPFRILGEAA